MKSLLQAVVAAGLVPILFTSCNLGRHAYPGPKHELTDLATIEVVETENAKRLIGHHKEAPNITYVDDFKVGSHAKGFPKKIYVLPGERVIKTEYRGSKTTKSAATTVGSIAGGALGAIIGGGIDRARNAKLIERTKRETLVTVQAGQEYQLKAQSEDGKGNGLRVWLDGASPNQATTN